MKIYLKENVYEKAIERISYLYDEFEDVVVGYSGGKDSTVLVHLALEVARKKGRLPVNVMWIDQEAEWQSTVDMCIKIMTMPEVKPYWYQMPMVITNNASLISRYNYCWDEKEKDKWIHPKHKLSIKENIYGTDRFHQLFEKILKVDFNDKKACYISGVRTEESPKRHMTLTEAVTYKWITWGKKLSKDQYTFYPIYDWSYNDIWKAIHDNGWQYNTLYDKMYQYGIPVREMRVSNVHHETSIQSLKLIQEIEPETWERIANRISGANTVKKLGDDSFTSIKEVPFMFKDWEEYTLYLNEKLVDKEKNRAEILKRIKKMEKIYIHDKARDMMYKAFVKTILSSDWDFTKLDNFEAHPEVYNYRKWVKKKPLLEQDIKFYLRNNLIPSYGKEEVIKKYEKIKKRN